MLLVEDDESIRELYQSALTAAGINTLTAPDGSQGVALALLHKPVVILMDITLPVMDGHEAVRKIREDDWGKTAKIIYLTNHSEPEHVVNAFAEKPEEYIIKANADIKEVVNAVRTAMHQ